MARVATSMSMSLDGFVTGPNPTPAQAFGGRDADVLHEWFFKHKTDEDVAILDEMVHGCGAVVMGRLSFDTVGAVGGWGDQGPVGGAPCFVVTHNAPTKDYGSVYTFVTDGVASAIEQAKAAAGDKTVGLHGAKIPQQALELGLLDEIHISLVPVLLGDGIKMFEYLGRRIDLERTRSISTPGATHLRFNVVR
jgi:dihydrofolate reductase